MEATHFIEVYKRLGRHSESGIKTIDLLKRELFISDFDVYTQTIAVWRIKFTDVPLQERMQKRGFSAMGFAGSDVIYQFIPNEYFLSTKVTRRAL